MRRVRPLRAGAGSLSPRPLKYEEGEMRRQISGRFCSGMLAVVVIAAVVSAVFASDALSARQKTARSVSVQAATTASTKIAFVCALPSIAFFGPIVNGANAAAKQLGVKLNYTGMGPTNVNGPAEATILKAAIAQKPAGLVVCNFFPSAESPLIKQAVAAGIPVIVANSGAATWQGDGAVAYLGEDSFQGGQAAATAMVKAGVKHPLCFDDTPGNPDVAARCAGFVNGMKSHGIKVTVVNDEQASSNPTAIAAAIKGELASKPIDGVLTMGPEQGDAASQAVSQVGKTGKVKVGTFDLSTNILNGISKGNVLFGIWQEPYLQGYLPVVMAYQYAKYGFSPVGYVHTGPLLVTKGNVAKVTAAVKAGLG